MTEATIHSVDTMTVAPPSTSPEAQLNDIIIKLEALREGYNTVLELAKRQLESLELSDDQLHNIAQLAAGRIDYGSIASRLTDRVYDCTVGEGGFHGQPSIEMLLDAITNRVRQRIATEIASRSRSIINLTCDQMTKPLLNAMEGELSAKLFTYIDQQIDRIETRYRNGAMAASTVRNLLELAYTEEELQAMASIPRAAAADDQSATTNA